MLYIKVILMNIKLQGLLYTLVCVGDTVKEKNNTMPSICEYIVLQTTRIVSRLFSLKKSFFYIYITSECAVFFFNFPHTIYYSLNVVR